MAQKESAPKKPSLKKPLLKKASLLKKPSSLKKPSPRPSLFKKPSPQDATPKSSPGKYALRVGIIFAFCHFIFVFFISIWGLHRSIIQTEHTSHLFYLLELPGALCAQLFGQTNPTETMPYLIIFFINTIFYLLVGIGVGHLIQKLKLVEDVNNLLLTEREIMEKDFEQIEIAKAPATAGSPGGTNQPPKTTNP